MNKKYLLIILFLIFSFNYMPAQTGTFDFENATTLGSGPQKVTQTVNGVTLTVSASANSYDDVVLYTGGGGVLGITGSNACYTAWQSSTQMVLTFDQSVNIASLRAGESSMYLNYTFVFTPNVGSPVTQLVDGVNGSDVNFGSNFVGITSITITRQGSGNINPVIDNIVMGGTLPVELNTFTAIPNGNMVDLKWATATEVNNYGFEVERKKAKVKSKETAWETIGFVKGNGNSNSSKSYSFADVTPPNGKVQYRLKQVDVDGKTEYSAIVEVNVEEPSQFTLEQNYPNPFNPTTSIKYQVSSVAHVTLKVYNMLGREAATLVNEQKEPGNYQVKFDGSKLSSGIYFYKLQAGNFTAVKKLMLVK